MSGRGVAGSVWNSGFAPWKLGSDDRTGKLPVLFARQTQGKRREGKPEAGERRAGDGVRAERAEGLLPARARAPGAGGSDSPASPVSVGAVFHWFLFPA